MPRFFVYGDLGNGWRVFVRHWQGDGKDEILRPSVAAGNAEPFRGTESNPTPDAKSIRYIKVRSRRYSRWRSKEVRPGKPEERLVDDFDVPLMPVAFF